MTKEDFSSRVAQAYASEAAALELGRAMLGDTVYQDATVQIPVAMCNRHGLIAGATGTGKTKTAEEPAAGAAKPSRKTSSLPRRRGPLLSVRRTSSLVT